MQTSQSFIATQRVSLGVYQRLRSTLMQQSTLFESVMTEAQFEAHFADDASGNLRTDGKVKREKDVREEVGGEERERIADSREALCFVVMRSPNLNVLLTARPIYSQSRPISGSYSLHSGVNDDVSPHNGNPHGDPGHRVAKQFAQNGQSSHFQADSDLINSPAATLSQAQLDPVEFSTAFVQEAVQQSPMATMKKEADNSDTDGPSQSIEYEINLSFDEQAILSFVDQLTPNGVAAHWRASEKRTTQRKKTTNGSPTKETADAKVLSREKFALSWAKQLANSPDRSTQATLNKQIQQSLLLNHVITRIRHSLDLPAILETTVAQVREFLSADRLVLYQFEQLEAIDFSSSASTTPLFHGDSHSSYSNRGTETGTVSERGKQVDKGDAKSVHTRPTTDLEYTGSETNGGTIIGRWTHDGYITYESRVSESISSVLNLSESACFMPSLPIRARYITGQPVAIDDIDKHYAHAECLLAFLRQAQVKSKMIAPIIVQDELWGLLIAHQCEDYRHWQETEMMFLQHIAEHLAVAICQASLYQQLQTQTDSLKNRVVERTQNLHDALIAAESADLTKGEFLSTMSHELRTPLTYIIGMSATLLRWSFGDLSDRQRSYLNTINHSGEQLLDIINDILDFAKISSGRTFLDVSEFSLSVLVQDVMTHFQPIADKQEVSLSLRFDVTSEQDFFQADIERLRQILSNLIHNAVKFTPAGGKVTLRVLRDDHETIFQVEDTGIGIPESQRDLLFEKFKQLESSFQRQYSGTGLGLAMTKRLVELHGGTIQVKSIVGKGSVFSVRLPFQMPDSEGNHYQVPRTLADDSRRILLLEVQENTAAIICDLLTADGYEVIWQEDVEKMLSQLVSLQPAILIADLSLLSHDLEEIKKMQRSITDIGTKVLALLGQPMSQSSHIAHNDTLTKPIDPKILLEKVRQLTLSAT